MTGKGNRNRTFPAFAAGYCVVRLIVLASQRPHNLNNYCCRRRHHLQQRHVAAAVVDVVVVGVLAAAAAAGGVDRKAT